MAVKKLVEQPALDLSDGKNVYFASDFHLGAPNPVESQKREKHIVRWLDQIADDAAEIYLVGDLFDFWFEYKQVVPKGFTRFIAKLAELTDRGIPVHVFTGNHDLWMFGYLEEEAGVTLIKAPIERNINGQSFLIGHGDGLGPGDYGYKFIKWVFTRSFFQWLFARLHPNFGVSIALFWSKRSRASNPKEEQHYLGDEREWLVQYCKAYLSERPIHYFVFGHRHLPLEVDLGSAKYVNLGDWISHYTYAKFDGKSLQLLSYSDH